MSANSIAQGVCAPRTARIRYWKGFASLRTRQIASCGVLLRPRASVEAVEHVEMNGTENPSRFFFVGGHFFCGSDPGAVPGDRRAYVRLSTTYHPKNSGQLLGACRDEEGLAASRRKQAALLTVAEAGATARLAVPEARGVGRELAVV